MSSTDSFRPPSILITDTKERRPMHDLASDQEPSKGKQRCYYLLFFVGSLLKFIISLFSLVFFVVPIAEAQAQTNHSIWDECVLYMDSNGVSKALANCQYVLVVEAGLCVSTGALVVVHLCLMCIGAKIFSLLHFINLLVLLCLGVLSLISGFFINIGQQTSCRNRNQYCNEGQLYASMELSFVVSAICFIYIGFVAVTLAVQFCLWRKQASANHSAEIVFLVGARKNSNIPQRGYSTMIENPFKEEKL